MIALWMEPYWCQSNRDALSLGIEHLKDQNYSRAIEVLKSYIHLNPDNTTGLICLGRAYGLSGKVSEAQEIFMDLSKRYPNNTEVKLNLAESHLWKKQTELAQRTYQEVIDSNALNSAALIGMANVFAAKSNFDSSFVYIQQAVKIDTQEYTLKLRNQILAGLVYQQKESGQLNRAKRNALKLQSVSSEETHLLLVADVLVVNREYRRALNLLDAVSSHEALLKKAYLNLILGRPQKSLRILEKVSDSSLQKTALQLEGLIALNRHQEIEEKITNYFNSTIKDETVELTIQRYASIHVPRFLDSNRIEQSPSLEQDIILWDANRSSLKVRANFDQLSVRKKEDLIPIRRRNANRIESSFTTRSDVDNTTQQLWSALYEHKWGSKHVSALSFKSETTENASTNQANMWSFHAQHTFRLNHKLAMTAGLTGQQSSTASGMNTQVFGSTNIAYRSKNNWNWNISYLGQRLNYGPELLGKNIESNAFGLTISKPHINRLSFYSQINREMYSDGNIRNSAFLSVYQNVYNLPIVKAGVNLNAISFKENRTEDYFSPERYISAELFLQCHSLEPIQRKWIYQIETAIGGQVINNESMQIIFRGRAELGYSFHKRYDLSLIGNYSNSSSTTIAGFTQYNMGIQLKLHL